MAGYGLRPYSGLGGSYNTGGFTEYPILDGDAELLFTGDLMMRETNGYVTRMGETSGASPTGASAVLQTIGPAVGFRYTNAEGQPTWSQHYPGGLTEAFAMVADDPHQLFVVQSDGLGATAVQADMGENAPLDNLQVSDANTSTGLSGIQVDISGAAATAALAVRLISIVQDGTNEAITGGTQTSNLIVRINDIAHAYSQTAVVTTA